MSVRVLEVDPDRWDRWLAGFAARHGPVAAQRSIPADGTVVRVMAADGATAVARGFEHDPLGLVLVRRGGYAVGLASGSRLLAAKVGSRRVQSRTAAGGWSQQRFARRREGQTAELLAAVAGHARRILLGDDESPKPATGGIPGGLVLGGDRSLVDEVVRAPALRALRDLPRRELPDLPNPTRAVLEVALRRGRALRVEFHPPPPPQTTGSPDIAIAIPHPSDNWEVR